MTFIINIFSLITWKFFHEEKFFLRILIFSYFIFKAYMDYVYDVSNKLLKATYGASAMQDCRCGMRIL